MKYQRYDIVTGTNTILVLKTESNLQLTSNNQKSFLRDADNFNG